MSLSIQTTIAQLLYLDTPPLNFARLVADLDLLMDRLPGVTRTLTWDCEDVAIFEAGSLRVLLAITDAPGTDYAACLTITAGPANAMAPQTTLLRRADQLCRLIERQLAVTTHPDATFWHRTPRVATADLVDTMIWSLADADLIAWAVPTDIPVMHAPAVQPMFLAPRPQHHHQQSGTVDLPWGLFTSQANRSRLAARSVAVASAIAAYGAPHLMTLM
jgi:hypothetical protein